MSHLVPRPSLKEGWLRIYCLKTYNEVFCVWYDTSSTWLSHVVVKHWSVTMPEDVSFSSVSQYTIEFMMMQEFYEQVVPLWLKKLSSCQKVLDFGEEVMFPLYRSVFVVVLIQGLHTKSSIIFSDCTFKESSMHDTSPKTNCHSSFMGFSEHFGGTHIRILWL